MSGNEISYHVAMDMMEEFRLIMKRFHKKSDTPYRKPEFQAMLFLSCKGKITMQELGEELHVTKPRVTALVSEVQMKKIKEKNILVYLKKESNALNYIEKLMKFGSNLCGINLMLEKRKHLIYC